MYTLVEQSRERRSPGLITKEFFTLFRRNRGGSKGPAPVRAVPTCGPTNETG